MLKVYFKITYIGLLVLTVMLTACSNKNREAEIYFVNTVKKLIQKKEEIDTDLTNLVKFEWTKVCFTKYEPRAYLTFTDEKTKKKNYLDVSENFVIDEGYVKGSPIKELYGNNSEITVHNCWDKGTLYIIKNFNTPNSPNSQFKIKIKGK